MATCEQNGHIYGHDAACVFCGEDRPKNQPHGPVSERFMRHHYGASRGAEEFDSHAAIENARRYVRLPTVDADSKRIISALLAALKGVVRVADRKTAEFDAARAAIATAEAGEPTYADVIARETEAHTFRIGDDVETPVDAGEGGSQKEK